MKLSHLQPVLVLAHQDFFLSVNLFALVKSPIAGITINSATQEISLISLCLNLLIIWFALLNKYEPLLLVR